MNNNKKQDISNLEILNQLVTPETGGDLIVKAFLKEAFDRARSVIAFKYNHVDFASKNFIGSELESQIKNEYNSMIVGSILHLLEELNIDPTKLNDDSII